jgi:hypothetical protein
MKITTRNAKDIFNLLSNSASTTLEDNERMKLVKIRAKLKPIANAYNEFNEDAEKTLKFEKFDDLNAKAQAGALEGDELLEWNLSIVKYSKSLAELREPELMKEHDIDIESISTNTYLKLEKENKWKMGAYDILEMIVHE